MTNNRKAPVFWPALLLGAATMLAAAAFAVSAADTTPAPAPAPAPAPDPPAGQLLIAAAAMQDPRFYHSVILLVHHDKNGAFGIVINRPIGERPLAALLAGSSSSGKEDTDKDTGKGGGSGAPQGTIQGTIRVFLGGPVEPQYGFVVHSADYHRAATLAIGDGLAMTATREVLRDIGNHRGPAKYLFAIGYSGWGAGQLEDEVARRDWFTEPAAPDLVFDADPGSVWEKALARRTREL